MYKKIVKIFVIVVFLFSIFFLIPRISQAGCGDTCAGQCPCAGCNPANVKCTNGGWPYGSCSYDPVENTCTCNAGCWATGPCGTGVAWPQCLASCGEGSVCISGQNAPCRCHVAKSCSDYITQPQDPVVTRVSPTEAHITWQRINNQYVTRMSLLVDAVYGNDPPVVDQQYLDPKNDLSWDATGLTPGKYYRVTTTWYAEGAPGAYSNCRENSNTTYLSSCRLNPNPLDLSAVGQTGMLTSEVVDDVGRVAFAIANGSSHSVATVSDTGNPDIFYPFANRIMAIGTGTTKVSNSVQLWQGGTTQAWVPFCVNNATIVNVGDPTPTPTRTPTPTPIPGAWTKLKNTSFISQNNLTSLVPLVPAAYDVDDDGTANFIVSSGGVVGAPSVNVTGTNANAKTSSPNEYKVTGYTPSNLMNPSSFLAYIKARKQHKVITSLGEITADGVYLWEGTYPLPINDSNKVRFDNYKVVLIGTSDININTNTGLDPANGSLAIIAPTITFANSVEEVNGIFIANNVSTGSPADQGLKIIGNLVAFESLTNDREWTNSNKPSLFIVFDQEKYIHLLPYLSTANYDWRQIQ